MEPTRAGYVAASPSASEPRLWVPHAPSPRPPLTTGLATLLLGAFAIATIGFVWLIAAVFSGNKPGLADIAKTLIALLAASWALLDRYLVRVWLAPPRWVAALVFVPLAIAAVVAYYNAF